MTPPAPRSAGRWSPAARAAQPFRSVGPTARIEHDHRLREGVARSSRRMSGGLGVCPSRFGPGLGFGEGGGAGRLGAPCLCAHADALGRSPSPRQRRIPGADGGGPGADGGHAMGRSTESGAHHHPTGANAAPSDRPMGTAPPQPPPPLPVPLFAGRAPPPPPNTCEQPGPSHCLAAPSPPMSPLLQTEKNRRPPVRPDLRRGTAVR